MHKVRFYAKRSCGTTLNSDANLYLFPRMSESSTCSTVDISYTHTDRRERDKPVALSVCVFFMCV